MFIHILDYDLDSDGFIQKKTGNGLEPLILCDPLDKTAVCKCQVISLFSKFHSFLLLRRYISYRSKIIFDQSVYLGNSNLRVYGSWSSVQGHGHQGDNLVKLVFFRILRICFDQYME